ncbi:MAG: hypothetical protein V4532_14080 [Pseudomonadota bacterium]
MPPQQPEQSRQQALLAWKTQFQYRLDGWRNAKLRIDAMFDCEFRLDYDQGRGSVTCLDVQDTAQISSLMQGLLRPLTKEEEQMITNCLRLSPSQLIEQSCASSTH